MRFLHSEIGSAKDNQTSSIHNWYKFTAGFSYKFVDEIIKKEKLKYDESSKIFDPFAGCGTTLVSAQKHQIHAVGNESQDFMCDIIRAKLNWKIYEKDFNSHLERIKNYIANNSEALDLKEIAHPLLLTLYKSDALKTLYLLKAAIAEINSNKYKLFFNLALSQTLHKVSIHPIAVPYIVRSKFLTPTHSAIETFEQICQKMLRDSTPLTKLKSTTKIYLHDSRKLNKFIPSNSCSVCITSPPYLNNLDYGEISKVHTHFFGVTENWNDITKRVRKKLVTGATTHYNESEFNLLNFKQSNFYNKNIKVANTLLLMASKLKEISALRSGKKSFDILLLLYFKDMYDILLEIKRVLKENKRAYLILGDSAPYGMHIPTTTLIGKIAKNAGFKSYRIYKIRTRGNKWKDLKYRHNLELTENVLVLS